MLDKIDTFLLERLFTPFAWWFERITSRSNFYLGWLCFGTSLLCLVMYWGVQFTVTHDFMMLDVVVGPVLLFVTGMLMIRSQRQDAKARDLNVMGDPYLMAVDRGFRMLFLLLSTLSGCDVVLPMHGIASIIVDPKVFEHFLWFAHDFAMFCAVYFIAVKRPPPRRVSERAGELQPARL